MSGITYVDIILIIPLLWFAYKGFCKGLIIELASLSALILGVYLAYHFSDYTAGLLTEKMKLETDYLHITAFALTFIAVVLLTYLTGKLLETVVKIAMLGFLNKLAGAAFGLIKAAMVLSVLLYMILSVDPSGRLIAEDTREKSVLYEPVASLVYIVIPKIREIDWDDYFPFEEEMPVDSLHTQAHSRAVDQLQKTVENQLSSIQNGE
ncbi:MAG: CvpA family protein [Bacteroidales bacterium]